MDPKLFNMAASGNVDALDRTNRHEKNTILLQRTHKGNNTALHIASKFGHRDFAAEIISLCPELLLQQNSRGDTALHNAARAGHTKVVRKLIECAVEQKKKDEMLGVANVEGNTVLHEAATNRNEEAVKLLMTKMPNLASVINRAGASPLYVAAEKGCVESVDHILSMVEEGSEDVHSRGPHERTPLHAAVIRQHLGITKTLIEKRKDYITQKDESGNYPIHYAAAIGNRHVVGEILQVDTSAAYQENRKQQSPFYVASSYGHVDVIKELVKFCPDSCFSVDKKGCNALHVAAKRGNLEVVKYILGSQILLELINEPNDAGNTPLQLAISKGRVSVSIFLINDKRVVVNIKNKTGETALDIAESNKIVTKNSKQVDKTGETASDIAESNKIATKRFEQIVICNALIKAEGTRGRMRLGSRSQKLEERIISYKDMFRVVPTIAALIMTVSFAAAFTIPGGFRNNDGKAVLGKKLFLWLFIVTDAVALFASIIVGLALLLIANLDNAQCNVDIVIAAHSICIKLMGISLVSLALAFLFGLLSILPIVLEGVLLFVLLCLLGLVDHWVRFLPCFPSLYLYLKWKIKVKLFSFLCPCYSHESVPMAMDRLFSRKQSYSSAPIDNQPHSSNQANGQPTNPPSSLPPIEVQGRDLPQAPSQVKIPTTNQSQSPTPIEIQHAILIWNSVSNEIPQTNQPQSSVSLVIPILDLIRAHTGTSFSSETQTALSNSLQNLNLVVNLPVTLTANLISTQNPVLHLIRNLPQQTSPQSLASSEIPHTNQPERSVSIEIGDSHPSWIPNSIIPHTEASFTSLNPLTQSSSLQNSSPTHKSNSHDPFTLTNPSQSPAPILHRNPPERSFPIGIGGAFQSSNTEASFTSSIPLTEFSTSLQNSNPAQVHNPFPLTNPTQLPAFQQSDTSSNGPRNENQQWDTSSKRGKNVQ